MKDRSCARARMALALLAAMVCVVPAASFHLGGDNDFARVGPVRSPSFGVPDAAAPDDCPACVLEGLASAVPSVCAPVAALLPAERIPSRTAPAFDYETTPRLAPRAPPAA